jgi:hypothetical protein
MEERLDELDDASYQLMVDIQTGRRVDAPRFTRGWVLLGLVAVVLGGLAGLLLASGNGTSQTTDLKQAPVSTSVVHTPQPMLRGRQDLMDAFVRSSPLGEDTPRVYAPLQESGSADIRPSPDRKAGPGTKHLSSSPATRYATKPSSASPTRVSKPEREPDRPGKDLPQRLVQRRSLQFSTRSVDSDFDPNAERVRSSP